MSGSSHTLYCTCAGKCRKYISIHATITVWHHTLYHKHDSNAPTGSCLNNRTISHRRGVNTVQGKHCLVESRKEKNIPLRFNQLLSGTFFLPGVWDLVPFHLLAKLKSQIIKINHDNIYIYILTESGPRPIQSGSRDVRVCVFVCVSVPSKLIVD